MGAYARPRNPEVDKYFLERGKLGSVHEIAAHLAVKILEYLPKGSFNHAQMTWALRSLVKEELILALPFFGLKLDEVTDDFRPTIIGKYGRPAKAADFFVLQAQIELRDRQFKELDDELKAAFKYIEQLKTLLPEGTVLL